MKVRSLSDIEKTDYFVNWGNGTSHRIVTQDDKMGYTVCHTVVNAGSESLLEYKNHLETCYCIGGSGEVEGMDGTIYPINIGDTYILDKHDKHYLRAHKGGDLILVSVFNPALKGNEKHNLDGSESSAY